MAHSIRGAAGTPVFDPIPADAADNPKFAALKDIYASTPSLIDAATPTPLEEVIPMGETDC